MTWWDIVWGKPVRAAVTVALAVVAAKQPDPFWLWTGITGGFIVASELISWLRQRQGRDRLAEVQQRALRVISDLAPISSNRYDLWVIDLYLPTRPISKGFRRTLVKEISLAHTHTEDVPATVSAEGSNIFGDSYANRKVSLWWDVALGEPSADDLWQSEDSQCSSDLLVDTYGALSVNPLLNQAGRDCRGILVAYAERDQEKVASAVSTLRTSEARRRLREACQDIHQLLKRG